MVLKTTTRHQKKAKLRGQAFEWHGRNVEQSMLVYVDFGSRILIDPTSARNLTRRQALDLKVGHKQFPQSARYSPKAAAPS